MDTSNEQPSGGVPIPSILSEPERDISKHNDSKSDAGVSSSCAISSHGETTDLRETLALRPRPENSTSTGGSKASDVDRTSHDKKSEQDQPAMGGDGGPSSDKPTSDEHEHGMDIRTNCNSTKGEPKVMKEYSAEARTYDAYYDEVGDP